MHHSSEVTPPPPKKKKSKIWIRRGGSGGPSTLYVYDLFFYFCCIGFTPLGRFRRSVIGMESALRRFIYILDGAHANGDGWRRETNASMVSAQQWIVYRPLEQPYHRHFYGSLAENGFFGCLSSDFPKCLFLYWDWGRSLQFFIWRCFGSADFYFLSILFPKPEK